MKNILLFLLMLGFSLPVYSYENPKGEVSRIYPNNNRIYFKLKNDTCNPNNKYYYFNLDTETSKAWYSLILAAANTSKPITVSISQCPTTENVVIRYIYQDF